MEKVPDFKEFEGRLVLNFLRKRGSRHVRMKLEESYKQFKVHTILDRELDNLEFIGYYKVKLSYKQLKGIIDSDNKSWKSALSHLNAIYIQTDCSCGKLYIGSAYGNKKLWGRWSDYVRTYHRGNKDLKNLYNKNGGEYFDKNFTYSILEVLEPNISKNGVIERENWWKEILQTRNFGYNNN